MKNHMLNIRNVVFRRKDRVILNRVSLSVGHSKIVGLLGAHGVGKTTLFDIICGIRSKETGNISGISSKRIAYLMQVVTVPDALKLGEMARLVYGLSTACDSVAHRAPKGTQQRILEKFEMLWDRRANACSYGEKRWFLLMVILSISADLYILDEPTAGVDPEYRFYIWESLARVREEGKSVLFSTHLVTEIEQHADYFYFLKGGGIRHFNNASTLMAEYGGATLEEAFVNYVTR